MKNFFITLVQSSCLAAMVYFGLIAGVNGAENLLLFYVWGVVLPFSMLSQMDAVQQSAAKKPKNIFATKFVSESVSWSALVVMIWTGNISTSVAWFISLVLLAVAKLGIETHRKTLESKE